MPTLNQIFKSILLADQVMSSLVPKSNPATELYQGPAGREYHDFKRALAPQAFSWLIALRAKKFQSYVGPSEVVFELGVGSGWNLAGLQCTRRIGCDAAKFLAERLSALGIEFVPEIQAVPAGTAHVAICHHTLEHLLDPAEALREVKRVLRPEGKLLIHTPWEREKRYSRYQLNDPNHHLFNWNPQNLGNFVSVLGYRIESVRCRHYGYDRFAANLAVRCHLGERGFRALRACLIALRPLREVELVARRSVG